MGELKNIYWKILSDGSVEHMFESDIIDDFAEKDIEVY